VVCKYSSTQPVTPTPLNFLYNRGATGSARVETTPATIRTRQDTNRQQPATIITTILVERYYRPQHPYRPHGQPPASTPDTLHLSSGHQPPSGTQQEASTTASLLPCHGQCNKWVVLLSGHCVLMLLCQIQPPAFLSLASLSLQTLRHTTLIVG